MLDGISNDSLDTPVYAGQTLLLRTRLIPGESLPSLAARLAHLNRYENVRFLERYLIKRYGQALTVGILDAPATSDGMAILSILTGLPARALLRASGHAFLRLLTPTETVARALSRAVPSSEADATLLRGALPLLPRTIVERELRPSLAAQYCPVCLRTPPRFHRSLWLPSMVTACLTHHCLLRHQCPGCMSLVSVESVVRNRCAQCQAILSSGESTDLTEDVRGLAAQALLQSWFATSVEPAQVTATVSQRDRGDVLRQSLDASPTDPPPTSRARASAPSFPHWRYLDYGESLADLYALTTYLASFLNRHTCYHALIEWARAPESRRSASLTRGAPLPGVSARSSAPYRSVTSERTAALSAARAIEARPNAGGAEAAQRQGPDVTPDGYWRARSPMLSPKDDYIWTETRHWPPALAYTWWSAAAQLLLQGPEFLMAFLAAHSAPVNGREFRTGAVQSLLDWTVPSPREAIRGLPPSLSAQGPDTIPWFEVGPVTLDQRTGAGPTGREKSSDESTAAGATRIEGGTHVQPRSLSGEQIAVPSCSTRMTPAERGSASPMNAPPHGEPRYEEDTPRGHVPLSRSPARLPPLANSLHGVYAHLIRPFEERHASAYLVRAYYLLLDRAGLWATDLIQLSARTTPEVAQWAQRGQQRAIATRLGVPERVISYFLHIGFFTPQDLPAHYEFGEEHDPIRVLPADLVAAEVAPIDGVAPCVAAAWLGVSSRAIHDLRTLGLLQAVPEATIRQRGGVCVTPCWRKELPASRLSRRVVRRGALNGHEPVSALSARRAEPMMEPAPSTTRRAQSRRPGKRQQPPKRSASKGAPGIAEPEAHVGAIPPHNTNTATETSASTSASSGVSTRDQRMVQQVARVRRGVATSSRPIWISATSLLTLQQEVFRFVRRQYLPTTDSWRRTLITVTHTAKDIVLPRISDAGLIALISAGQLTVYRTDYERSTSLRTLCVRDLLLELNLGATDTRSVTQAIQRAAQRTIQERARLALSDAQARQTAPTALPQ